MDGFLGPERVSWPTLHVGEIETKTTALAGAFSAPDGCRAPRPQSPMGEGP